MTLAEWIVAQGITRTKAAARLGISASYLTELCQQKRSPSSGLAIKIVDETGGKVTFRELVNGAESVPHGTQTKRKGKENGTTIRGRPAGAGRRVDL